MEYKSVKILKLKSHLVEPTLNGTKTVTWRLFDDKSLRVGDRLTFTNSDTGDKIADAEITGCEEKQIKDLTEDELKENAYSDLNHVIELNRRYYGEKVDEGTVVKIIRFRLR